MFCVVYGSLALLQNKTLHCCTFINSSNDKIAKITITIIVLLLLLLLIDIIPNEF